MNRWIILFVSACSVLWSQAPYKLFSGSVNTELANSVADTLGVKLSKISVGRFSDGEVRIQILENVRNCDVFVMQSTCLSRDSSVNDSLMELYLMIRAMKRASANSVTVIIPYFGYARQDRKMEGRVPISASDVAMIIEKAGADRVVAIDLHCGQIQGFFHDVPVDNLFASYIFVPQIAKEGLYNPVIVSPDAGGVERAKVFIEGLSALGIPAQLAIIIKQRAGAGVIDKMSLIGDVAGRDAIVVDDICDTAGTLVEAAKMLKAQGARRVLACITHPVLSGPACARIAASLLEKIYVTDTIPLRCSDAPKNIQVLSVAPLLGSAIDRMANGESISDLFHWKHDGRVP